MPQRTPQGSPKVQTSITLEPEVLDYLTRVAREEERTRSEVVSRIVRRDAERTGRTIFLYRRSPSPGRR